MTALPPASTPEVFKPIRCQLGVPNGVLDVFVAEPSLQRTGVVARVRQGVAAAMSQHVRMYQELHFVSCYAMARGRAPPPRQISRVGCLSLTLRWPWAASACESPPHLCGPPSPSQRPA